jgi:hypothetical protein
MPLIARTPASAAFAVPDLEMTVNDAVLGALRRTLPGKGPISPEERISVEGSARDLASSLCAAPRGLSWLHYSVLFDSSCGLATRQG